MVGVLRVGFKLVLCSWFVVRRRLLVGVVSFQLSLDRGCAMVGQFTVLSIAYFKI